MILRVFLAFLSFALFSVSAVQAAGLEVYEKCMDATVKSIDKIIAVEQLDKGCKCVSSRVEGAQIKDFGKDLFEDSFDTCFTDIMREYLGLKSLDICLNHPNAKDSAVYRNMCRCFAKTYATYMMRFGLKPMLDKARSSEIEVEAREASLKKCKR